MKYYCTFAAVFEIMGFMKKLVYLVVLSCIGMMFFATGCTDKKPAAVVDTPATDSVLTDSTDTDTVTKIIAETPMPKAADQLFDDFFFNFIANRKLQKSRVRFPLPVTTGGKTVMMARNHWKTDHFFSRQGYYTLIFDDPKQMMAAKSTKIDTVVVERIFLNKGTVEQFCFDHQNGHWMLSAIHNIGFSDSPNASFLKFLPKFFASQGAGKVKDPLPYSGPDPNGEDTKIINMKIAASEWSGFLPEIPSNVMYNILYGQKYKDGNRKILSFKGLSNGLETQLIFKRRGGKWRLEKLNAF